MLLPKFISFFITQDEEINRKEKEAQMDSDQLRRLKETEEETAKHETSKTAHFAKLGKAFARGGSLLFSPTGGRGTGGGGRGGALMSPTGRGQQR